MRVAAALAAASLALATPGRTGPGEGPAPLALTALTLAAGEGSGQPWLAESGAGVLLSWLEPGGEGRHRFRFARLDDGAWSAPRTIVERPDLFVNWADVPSIVDLGDGRLAAHWLQKSGPGPYAYDVRVSRSADHGATWSPSIAPHRDGTQTEHGFASLVDRGAGRLGVVWLDGRETAGGHGQDHGAGGAMTLRAATIEPDGRLADEALVDSRVCDCCPTAAVVSGGDVIAAYRDRGDREEVRDISLARFARGRWTTEPVGGQPPWLMPACPVNGPALDARGRHVALAWFTAEGGGPRVLAAVSSDGGRTFGAAVRVDEAVALGRVDVAVLDDGSAVVGWIEFAPGASAFLVRRIGAGGARGPALKVGAVSSERGSGYPRLARSRDALVLAWRDVAAPAGVRTAVARLPLAAGAGLH